MHELWEEIRRRNLHRVTAAYAVVSWILVQAAGLLFPAFALPGWTLRLLVVLLIAALPILWVALWLSHPVAHRYDTLSERLHKTEWMLIALLSLVLIASVGEFAYSQFRHGTWMPSAAGSPRDASIAVLAFDNMSGDRNNEYFSEGISEELLNDLSQVRGLRVAGRTSSFSFKGKSVSIPEIGKALHVRTVLEGSVRREGNRVRITAQLVNAADDFHLWSQTYDRQISDIFAVQDEISRAITRELTGRLLGTSHAIKTREKVNPKAYTAYLQGRFFMNKRNKNDMLRAIDFFKQAIALEPDYADAHAALAKSYGVMFGNAQSHEDLKPAIEEADAALRLDPDNLDALIAKSIIASNQWKWAEAEAALRRVLARAPNSADAHNQIANLLADIGLRDAALTQFRRAAELDPLAPIPRANEGVTLFQLKRDGEAIKSLESALTLDPNSGFAMATLCRIHAEEGNISQAQAFQSRLTMAGGDAYTHQCEAFIAKAKGDEAALKRIAEATAEAYARGEESALSVGLAYARSGDNGTAMSWFERSYRDRDHALFKIGTEPDFPPQLAADPRWQKLMQSPGAQDVRNVRAEIAARGTGY